MAPFDEQEREAAPEERPPAPEVGAEEEPETALDDAAEPAGDQDAGNEAEIEEATERPDAVEEQGGDDDPLAQARRERDEYLDLAKRAQAEGDGGGAGPDASANGAGDAADDEVVDAEVVDGEEQR